MFTLDRPTCVRNMLSGFQVVQGFSAPAGRCSSTLMLRCILSSSGSSRSLHSSMWAALVVVLMGSEHLIKLFRYFRCDTTPTCSLSRCLWSVVCRVRSVRLATALLVSDGGNSGEYGRLLVLNFVGFIHPVIIRQVSFSVASSFFAWFERSHTGNAYYAAESHSARADDLSVVGVAPYFEVLCLRMMFLVQTFFFVSLICALYDNVRSSVTPNYTGMLQWLISLRSS